MEVQVVDAPEQPNYDEGVFDWVPYEEVKAPGNTRQDGNGSAVGGDSFDGGGAATTPDTNGDGVPDVTVPAGTVETVPGQTNPAGTDGTQQEDPDSTDNPSGGKKLTAGQITAIVVPSAVFLGGGGFALYGFVIKPEVGSLVLKKLLELLKSLKQ